MPATADAVWPMSQPLGLQPPTAPPPTPPKAVTSDDQLWNNCDLLTSPLSHSIWRGEPKAKPSGQDWIRCLFGGPSDADSETPGKSPPPFSTRDSISASPPPLQDYANPAPTPAPTPLKWACRDALLDGLGKAEKTEGALRELVAFLQDVPIACVSPAASSEGPPPLVSKDGLSPEPLRLGSATPQHQEESPAPIPSPPEAEPLRTIPSPPPNPPSPPPPEDDELVKALDSPPPLIPMHTPQRSAPKAALPSSTLPPPPPISSSNLARDIPVPQLLDATTYKMARSPLEVLQQQEQNVINMMAAEEAKKWMTMNGHGTTPFMEDQNNAMVASEPPPLLETKKSVVMNLTQLMMTEQNQRRGIPYSLSLGKQLLDNGLLMTQQMRQEIPNPGKYQVLVEFKRKRVLQYSSGTMVAKGDYVIVAGDRGEDIGQAIHSWVTQKGTAGVDEVPSSGCVIRVATLAELQQRESNLELEKQAMEQCNQRLAEYSLDMELVDAEFQFDRKKLTFFYKAQTRQDFRELIRDLYKMFRARIWMEKVDE